MATDRPMDAEAFDAWAVLWQIRELLLSVPPPARRGVLETAIQQTNAVHGNEFERQVRQFMAEILPPEGT